MLFVAESWYVNTPHYTQFTLSSPAILGENRKNAWPLYGRFVLLLALAGLAGIMNSGTSSLLTSRPTPRTTHIAPIAHSKFGFILMS